MKMAIPSSVLCASMRPRNPHASINRPALPLSLGGPRPQPPKAAVAAHSSSTAIVCAQLRPELRRPVMQHASPNMGTGIASNATTSSSSKDISQMTIREKAEAAKIKVLAARTTPSPMPKLEKEKPWPSPDGWRLTKAGTMVGETFGESTYKVYEAVSDASQVDQEPYFFIWLHGADGGNDIPPNDLAKMQKRLRRRIFFFVPISPKPSQDGNRFFWGVAYTKAQNKNDLGFVHGSLHEPYLQEFCRVVKELSQEVGAIATVMAGYSMGGFGAWQIAGYMPDLFTAIIPVASYGLGTYQKGGMYNAPQPESSHIFDNFMNWMAPNVAQVPVVIAIHAQIDTTSPYGDAQAMVKKVQGHGGKAQLVSISAEGAESDKGKRKVKSGHSYFNHSLLNDDSEGVLYGRLRILLQAAINQGYGQRGNGNGSRIRPISSTGSANEPPMKKPKLLKLPAQLCKPAVKSTGCKWCDQGTCWDHVQQDGQGSWNAGAKMGAARSGSTLIARLLANL